MNVKVTLEPGSTPAAVLAGIKARHSAELEARNAAERAIREANERYKQADANARALEKLAELYAQYAAGAQLDGPVPY